MDQHIKTNTSTILGNCKLNSFEECSAA
jgi:hypothetical protein